MAQLNTMELLSRQLNLLVSWMERLQRFLASAPIPNTSFPELSAGGHQGKLRPELWRLICPQKLIRSVHLSVLFPCLSPPPPRPHPLPGLARRPVQTTSMRITYHGLRKISILQGVPWFPRPLNSCWKRVLWPKTSHSVFSCGFSCSLSQ